MADKDGVKKVLFIIGFLVFVFIAVTVFNFATNGGSELVDATGSQLYDLPTTFSSYSFIYIFMFVILVAVLVYLYFKA